MSIGATRAAEGATVLVVDDEPDVRQIVTFVLGRAGYRVLQAEDGRAAVAMLDEHGTEIDLVLLDVMMPRMTGPEALPAIRRRVPAMPVVFFSGYDRSEVAEHLHDADAFTEFVGKPFDNRVLLEVVARGIAGAGSGD